jgi:hypothetical protein
MSLYIVLEAKYVRNWKNEAREWTHYPVRNKKIVKYCEYRPCSRDVSPAPASHASPPARPPTPRPARPPAQHVAETRYRDSSRPPVRNRLTYGWGYGVRESRARPSFPVSIRHTRDVIGIRVKLKHIILRFYSPEKLC